jgi:pectinesterase
MLARKLFCAVFALGAGTAAAAVLTDTNFNSTSVGSAPSTYTISEAGGTVRIAGTPSSSNRSVFLNDTSTTTLVSAKKTFTAQSGVVDVEFKFMQPTLVNNTKVFRLLSGTTAAVSIETIGGALQYRGPNSVYTNILSGYVANRWYSLRVVANAANDTADVYINGVRKVTAGAFFSAVTSLDGFDSFTPNTSAGSHYLDDVVIKSVSTAIPGGALVVDFNGTGNYMTVGAAIAAIPANNTTPRVIYVKNGTYNERLNFPADKQNITLLGQSATGTILSCNDTSASAGGTTNSSCTFVRGNGFTAKNITFRNNAGQTAGQAVALYVSGDRDAFYNVRVLGWQDTLYANGSGRQYYRDSYIEGHVDFIFGSGTAVFESCEIRSLAAGVAITAASTDQTNPWGYVFINSSLTRSGSLDDTTDLGRPWRPYSSVTYLYSWMDTHIRPVGWNNWSDPANEATARYSEFGNTGPGSGTSARVSWAHQLSSSQAAAINAQSVLARTDAWNPAAVDP